MRALWLVLKLVKWDVLRELRRRETVLNMSLFALLLLFVLKLGLGPDRKVTDPLGPVVFWMTILFSGTVGLSQSLVAEREGGRLEGIVTAPVDLGFFYLAKVIATGLYVFLMELLVLGAYVLFFGYERWDLLAALLAVMGVFTAGYIGCGVLLAGMTAALRGGGEIVLRILLLPLMMPLLYLTLQVSESVFGVEVAGGFLGPPMALGTYLSVAGAFDAIYIASGFLIFPKVIEE